MGKEFEGGGVMGKGMNTFLVDYYFLDQQGNREEDYCQTVELKAESSNGKTIKSMVEKYLSDKEIGYWDIEIYSIGEAN